MKKYVEDRESISFQWWHYLAIIPLVIIYSITPISSLNYYVPVTAVVIFSFLRFLLKRSNPKDDLDLKTYVIKPTGLYYLGELLILGLYGIGLDFLPMSLIPFLTVLSAGLFFNKLELPNLWVTIPVLLIGIFLVGGLDRAVNIQLMRNANAIMATGSLSAGNSLGGKLVVSLVRILATTVFMGLLRIKKNPTVEEAAILSETDEVA